MEKRIYGLETEYGVILPEHVDYDLPIMDNFFKEIFGAIRPAMGSNSTDGFYLNGARIYLEVSGHHPEYATPECCRIKDVIKWDKAGERIFEDSLNRACARSGNNGRMSLFKNNLDATAQATFGCHENYMISRCVSGQQLAALLVPFLVSRQIICGSGYLGPDGFQISQRAQYIANVTAGSSTQLRPIIHEKDESLADREKWRRIHLIIGDANMNQVAAFLKIGTTALVLRMIEAGHFCPPIELVNPVTACKRFSYDPLCDVTVGLNNPVFPEGPSQISAIEIQQIYLDAAKVYLDRESSVEPEWREVAASWEKVLNDLKANPMRLYRQIDWVTKKWLMESVLERFGCDWDSYREAISGPEGDQLFNRLKTVDLVYHDIGRDSGLYNILEKHGLVETLITEEEISEAKTEPPQDTRAKWRGEFIRFAKDERFRNLLFQVSDWETVSIAAASADSSQGDLMEALYHRHKYVHRFDPFDSQSPDIEAMLRQ